MPLVSSRFSPYTFLFHHSHHHHLNSTPLLHSFTLIPSPVHPVLTIFTINTPPSPLLYTTAFTTISPLPTQSLSQLLNFSHQFLTLLTHIPPLLLLHVSTSTHTPSHSVTVLHLFLTHNIHQTHFTFSMTTISSTSIPHPHLPSVTITTSYIYSLISIQHTPPSPLRPMPPTPTPSPPLSH